MSSSRPEAPIEAPGGWREHSQPNVTLRRNKARKIITLIETRRPIAGARVLEIGTGSGVISAELAKSAGPGGAVLSVDTMDTRLDPEGYEFRLTSGARLPYDDASFDVVVSNHVVEHIGARPDQQMHLAEIARVLRPGGLGYLATPTRWALIEPHFKVPAVAWLPRSLRDGYIRLLRAGKVYDVDPYGRRELQTALGRTGLRWADATLDAITLLGEIEGARGAVGVLLRVPPRVRRLVRPALPTMVFLLERPGDGS